MFKVLVCLFLLCLGLVRVEGKSIKTGVRIISLGQGQGMQDSRSSSWNYSFKDCSETRIEACLTPVNSDLEFPDICNIFDEAMSCMDEFAADCWTDYQKQQFTEFIAETIETMENMCQ